MTSSSIITLFITMAILASIPSVSVVTVTARSAAFGFIHGVLTTVGIVVGDVVFILLAISGLSILAETMGGLFVFVKYLGGAYLIWLGIRLWRLKKISVNATTVAETSLQSSFLAGLFITLGDQKAILFYLGFFPAFIDLTSVSYLDASIIVMTAIVTVGGVKLVYAFMAERAVHVFNGSGVMQSVNKLASMVMIAVGVFLIIRA